MTMCFVNDNVQNNYFHLMKTEYERLLNVPNEHNHKYFIIQMEKKCNQDKMHAKYMNLMGMGKYLTVVLFNCTARTWSSH